MRSAQCRHADRRLPGRAQAGGHGPAPLRAMSHAQAGPARRARAQPAERRRSSCRCSGWCRHRRQRLGQEHAGAGRAGAALARHFGKPTERPARTTACWAPTGWPTPCSSTRARSARPRAATRPATWAPSTNPRKLFADAPLARERSYTAGMFSFNAGDGRCPTCGGSGFEHVEMQFLSDVYLRCPDCDGRRYRAEVLDVKLTRGAIPAQRGRRAGPDGQPRPRTGSSATAR
jgi:hypothetical protein